MSPHVRTARRATAVSMRRLPSLKSSAPSVASASPLAPPTPCRAPGRLLAVMAGAHANEMTTPARDVTRAHDSKHVSKLDAGMDGLDAGDVVEEHLSEHIFVKKKQNTKHWVSWSSNLPLLLTNIDIAEMHLMHIQPTRSCYLLFSRSIPFGDCHHQID